MSDPLACDVLIVGGGPAGLSVAGSLGPGISAIVLHQDAEIGRPVRTSGGTWVRDMEALGIPQTLYQVIDRLDFYSDQSEARFAVRDDKMAVMDVTGVYQHLAGLIRGDIPVMLGTSFVSAVARDDGYVATVRSREMGEVEISARFVIEASGWKMAVMEALGLGEKPARRGVGIEYEFDNHGFDPNRAILFVGSAALNGYGWVFPTPDGRLRLGIGVINPDTERTPREGMEAFLASGFAEKLGVQVPNDYEVNAGVIPSVPYDPKLVYGHVIRTGDAANFATPTVGEGIRIAIEEGRALGAALTAFIAGGAQALVRHERACARKYQRDYRFGFMMNQRIARYDPTRWDKSVARLARLSELEMTALVRSRFGWRTIARTVWLSVLGKLRRDRER